MVLKLKIEILTLISINLAQYSLSLLALQGGRKYLLALITKILKILTLVISHSLENLIKIQETILNIMQMVFNNKIYCQKHIKIKQQQIEIRFKIFILIWEELGGIELIPLEMHFEVIMQGLFVLIQEEMKLKRQILMLWLMLFCKKHNTIKM